ncbi:MAG: VCBS repeat-containing protein [Planctomycetota bacterium]
MRAALLFSTLAVLLPASAFAQQFAELEKRYLSADLGPTASVAIGDVDGDGDGDLVFGNRLQDRLLINDGLGTFTDVTATALPAAPGTSTLALILGDVDGDGDLDLISEESLYLNDGSGTFTDGTAGRLPTVNGVSALALGDVDGDGDPDLAFGTVQRNQLYLNDGSGTFVDVTASHWSGQVSSATVAIVPRDVDGDGDLDLVCGNYAAQDRLYLNNGTGIFSDATVGRMPADTSTTQDVAAADVDGDGDPDLVFVSSGRRQNRLYLNDGSGTFADATSVRMPVDRDISRGVVLSDVDGDGDPDLVVANEANTYLAYRGQSTLYLNDGSGTFTDATATHMPPDSEFDHAVALGDLDGDRRPDLVFIHFDVAFQHYEQQNRLYFNDGTGRFADVTARRLPVGNLRTSSIALADVDGDGDGDLVLGNVPRFYYTVSGQNRMFLNDGTGVFTEATGRLPRANDNTSDVALGDVDADGDADLVLGNRGEQNRLYLNDGSGSFTDATATHMPRDNGTTALALGDVNADGDTDLVLGKSGQNRLYLNDGSGVFTDATEGRLPLAADDSSRTRAVALADVDADGDLDLLFGNCSRPNRLYRNDGAGIFVDVTATHLPGLSSCPAAIALGDVDADGDLDLVFGNAGQDQLYLNDGAGMFTDVTGTHMPVDSDWSTDAAFVDADGDGDPDLVFGSAAQVRLYRNDGAGVFIDVTATEVPVGAGSAVAVGDLDGDADPDLAFGNDGRRGRPYFNLLRQLHTPLLARIGRPYRLVIDARSGGSPLSHTAVPMLASAAASVPLAPLGTLRLDPTAMILLPAQPIPPKAGSVTVSLRIPNDRELVGLRIFSQAVVLHPVTAPRFTNLNADTILRS